MVLTSDCCPIRRRRPTTLFPFAEAVQILPELRLALLQPDSAFLSSIGAAAASAEALNLSP